MLRLRNFGPLFTADSGSVASTSYLPAASTHVSCRVPGRCMAIRSPGMQQLLHGPQLPKLRGAWCASANPARVQTTEPTSTLVVTEERSSIALNQDPQAVESTSSTASLSNGASVHTTTVAEPALDHGPATTSNSDQGDHAAVAAVTTSAGAAANGKPAANGAAAVAAAGTVASVAHGSPTVDTGVDSAAAAAAAAAAVANGSAMAPPSHSAAMAGVSDASPASHATNMDPLESFDSFDSFDAYERRSVIPPNPMFSPTTGGLSTSPGTMNSIAVEDTPEFLTDVEVQRAVRPFDWLSNQRDIVTLSYAVIVGGVVAASVFSFDVTIQYIHDIPDNLAKMGIGGGRTTGLPIPWMESSIPFRCIMPIGAGFAVAWLQTMGFAPPLKVVTRAVDSVKDDVKNASLPKDYGQVVRKAAASAITLGSGASLGPEAPSVELGANTAAVIIPKKLSRRRQRMLLAAGAAAGVSAAFDAPVAGALFAVEFVLKSSRLGLDRLSTSTVFVSTSVAAAVVGFLRAKGQALGVTGAASHLVGRIPYFSIQPNLLYDVAQFSLLGVGCAGAAVALYEGVRISEIFLRPMPRWVSAPLAGAMCGAIALKFPTIQYGYVNLEEVFRDSTHLSVGGLVGLLSAKIAATSVCVGGGLVGGLFAPSLFLGALVGDIVGHFFYEGVADATSFVVVGAAAVLGAACRAPLTAITLMVEITRDTGLLVPLLAAIGTASLVTDYVEGTFSKWLEGKLVEMYLKEKTMFWGANLVAETTKPTGPIDAVESAMCVTTNLYVRHSLPLLQAREAMVANKVKAAVVVDDNFSPVGVAYLDDVEEEMVRQRMLNERDNNFGTR